MFAVLLGFFGTFVQDLWTGKAFGGGPIEALIRLVNQDNLIKPLEFGHGRHRCQDRQVRRQHFPHDHPRVVRRLARFFRAGSGERVCRIQL